MSKIVLFTGGARSVNSRRAEEYAARCGPPVTYVATAAAGDDEMAERIRLHREQRPAGWATLEAPAAVAPALRGLERGGVALLDCLSLLVSNLLLANERDPQPAVEAEVAALLAAAAERDLTLIVVTNEVGMGVVPEYPLGRIYRDLLGRAAQRIAAAAAEAYLVVAGIPVELRSLAGHRPPATTHEVPEIGCRLSETRSRQPTADLRQLLPTDHRPPAHGSIDYAELAASGIEPAALLDFSSNLNPAGPPPAIRALLAGYDPAPYPDRHCLALRGAIAERHGCDLGHALAGNGSNELIHLIARALLGPGDSALVLGPTFGEYAHASRLAGAAVIEWTARQSGGFQIDSAAVARLIEQQRPRLVWLCNPNNPTGTLLGPAGLRELAAACAATGGLLVIDHAYAALLRTGDSSDAVPAGPHVLHLHSLTKSHALAGLRLGYLLGAAGLIARIAAFQPSWSVNGLAQAAGVAALADRDFLAASLPQWWRWSDDLRAELIAAGAAILPSELPFFLVETPSAAALRSALLRRGCLVRDCASFGLERLARIAPRRPEDNARLVASWGRR